MNALGRRPDIISGSCKDCEWFGARGAGRQFRCPQLRDCHLGRGAWFSKLLKMFGNPPFEFVLWNGEHILPEGHKPIARVTIREPSVLLGLLRNPGVRFWRRLQRRPH